MKTYYVEYKMHSADDVHGVDVLANSKEEAYNAAAFEVIPGKESGCPYSVWVSSVTYNNGNYKLFNNFEGKPY